MDNTIWSLEKEQSLKNMITSCFTYGGADRDSYNYTKYIEPYKKELDEILFNVIYINHLTDLKNNFKIKNNVYTDREGCTYNELVKI